MKFINRLSEINKLHKALKLTDANFIVVYGRRRCGKSTLLKQIIHTNDIYFQADLNTRSIQLSSLSDEIAKTYTGFNNPQYNGWEALLLSLTKYIGTNNSLIIDEFPYLVKNTPELPSVLQKLIDSKQLNYNIIICGSSQQMMHDIVMKKSEPLYGRASLIMKIEAIKPGYIREAIPGNAENAVYDYAVIGGVPRYWEIRNNYTNIYEFIENETFDKDSIFSEEPVRLLNDDMRSSIQAYSLLTLIGQGCNRLSEIAARIGRPATDLSKPLSNLIELGYIKKEIPFGENEKNSKKSLYKIHDHFFRFYFQYIFPNKSSIALGLKNRLVSKLKIDFEHYVSQVWEDMVRDSIPYSNIMSKEWTIAKRWWGKDNTGMPLEIDLISESTDKKSILIGEIKWSNKPDFERIQERLIKISQSLLFVQNYENIVIAQWHKAGGYAKSDKLIFYPNDVLTVMV